MLPHRTVYHHRPSQLAILNPDILAFVQQEKHRRTCCLWQQIGCVHGRRGCVTPEEQDNNGCLERLAGVL